VDPSLPDADLERLLAHLLRAVNPAAMGGALRLGPAAGDMPPEPGPADKEDTGTAADAGGAVGQGVARAAARGVPEDPGGVGGAVSASEARALIELVAARGIAQGQLAALLGLEKSTVSRLAAGLERKGWLRRGRDQQNQRYVRLYLTPAGRAVAGQVWRAWQSRQARVLAALTPEERAGLAAGLRGLVRGLAAEGLLDPAAFDGTQGPRHTAPAPGAPARPKHPDAVRDHDFSGVPGPPKS
jgi:DNA-binding MarR family transcriptional regulator